MPEATTPHYRRLSNWLREWLNRPSQTPAPEAVFDLFDADAEHLRQAPESRERGSRLLVVLTTHGRAEGASQVLDRLHSACSACAGPWAEGIRVLVVEDASQEDYSAVRARAQDTFGQRLGWLRSKRHLGKPDFWAVYQAALCVAQRVQPDYVLILQDDIEFETLLLSRALELLQILELRGSRTASKPNPCVLSLFSAADDEQYGRWIRFQRYALPDLPVRRTQWFDLPAVVFNRAVLELLQYRMIPVHPHRWKVNPKLSSGVGQQLTRRLHRRAWIYQCFPPLVFHGALPSKMNPEARADRCMDNRGFRANSLARSD